MASTLPVEDLCWSATNFLSVKRRAVFLAATTVTGIVRIAHIDRVAGATYATTTNLLDQNGRVN